MMCIIYKPHYERMFKNPKRIFGKANYTLRMQSAEPVFDERSIHNSERSAQNGGITRPIS